MSSTNQSPHYQKAEGEYLSAQTTEQKIRALKKMISLAPKHKGAENLRANLKRRFAKLKYTKQKESKKGKSTKIGIKKEEMQAVLIGFTNSGKSSLLSLLTNTKSEITGHGFVTKRHVIGMMPYSGINIQLIEIPSIKSEYYDKGLVNSADTVLLVIESLSQLKEIEVGLEFLPKKSIIVFNKIDLLSEEERRKIQATLQSKKYEFSLVSAKTGEGLRELQDKIFQSFGKIRVYLKEPGKPISIQNEKPVVLNFDSSVKEVAEKILHGFSSKIKETRIWGPSSKFPGQIVGLNHKLKDLDIVEFKTR